MSIPSQSDFDSWKQDSVTKAFFLAIVDQIEQSKEYLSTQAGLNSAEDNFHRGYIRAFQDALLFRIDDLQETAE